MTDDNNNDNVTMPRELAKRLRDAISRSEWSPDGNDAMAELDDILDPSPFDPKMVAAIAREIHAQAPFDGDRFEDLNDRRRAGHRASALNFLRAAREAGYVMAPAAHPQGAERLEVAERLLRRITIDVNPDSVRAFIWLVGDSNDSDSIEVEVDRDDAEYLDLLRRWVAAR